MSLVCGLPSEQLRWPGVKAPSYRHLSQSDPRKMWCSLLLPSLVGWVQPLKCPCTVDVRRLEMHLRTSALPHTVTAKQACWDHWKESWENASNCSVVSRSCWLKPPLFYFHFSLYPGKYLLIYPFFFLDLCIVDLVHLDCYHLDFPFCIFLSSSHSSSSSLSCSPSS